MDRDTCSALMTLTAALGARSTSMTAKAMAIQMGCRMRINVPCDPRMAYQTSLILGCSDVACSAVIRHIEPARTVRVRMCCDTALMTEQALLIFGRSDMACITMVRHIKPARPVRVRMCSETALMTEHTLVAQWCTGMAAAAMLILPASGVRVRMRFNGRSMT
ncbi:MAG: hypothetical protein WCN95_12055 [bacterium]